MKTFNKIGLVSFIMAMVWMCLATTGNIDLANYGTVGAGAAVGVSTFLASTNPNHAFTTIVIPEFTTKTSTEILAMTPEQRMEYLDKRREFELATERDWTQKEVERISKEKADGWEAKVTKLNDDLAKTIRELEDANLLIKSLTEKGGKAADQKEKTALMKYFTSKERTGQENFDADKSDIEKDLLSAPVGKSNYSKQTVLKAAELMSIGAVGAGTAHITTANGYSINVNNFIDPNIYSVPKNKIFIMNYVSVTTQPGTEKIWWSERNTEEGDAEFLAEGGTKPLVSAKWQTKSADIKEVAERWKFTKRLLLHTRSVADDFQKHARELIEQKIDDQVLTGDGLTVNLSGIIDQASAFVVPAGLANYYDYVNIYDVMMAVLTQIEIANFSTTAICLHTSWRAKMFGVKSQTEAMYILHPLVTPDGRTFAGIPIIFTNKMDEDYILAGDLSKFNVVFSENIMFDEGYSGTDFDENLISRKLEAFMGTYIPAPEAPAIVYDQIATIESAIANTAS